MDPKIKEALQGTSPELREDIVAFRLALADLAHEMVTHLTIKRASYGAGNLTRHGLYGILIRSDDKAERLRQMYVMNVPRTTASGETEQDAWDDILGYALLAGLFLRYGARMYPDPTASDPDPGESEGQ